MIVKLYKKTSDSWSGVALYANCKHGIGSYITRSGGRYTGLDNLTRERLEKELGRNLGPTSEFWDTFRINITSKDDKGLTFNTDDPFDELKVRFLEGHKRVANGYMDKKMGADYVIVKEEQAAEEINKKAKIKIESIKEFEKLTPDQMRKVLRLYGHKSNNVSIEIVQSTLFTLVEEDPKKFKELWIDNPYRDTQFLIEEAVASNIIRKNKTLYKYGTDIIGNSIEEAIDYLRDPGNANLRIAIKSQIEGKRTIEKPVEEREVKSQVSQLLEEIIKEEVSVATEMSSEDEKYEAEKAKEIMTQTPIEIKKKK